MDRPQNNTLSNTCNTHTLCCRRTGVAQLTNSNKPRCNKTADAAFTVLCVST